MIDLAGLLRVQSQPGLRLSAAAFMTPPTILFCEGNTDGTIGGSYFSLLYLIEGLDKTRVSPLVVFHRPNAMLEAFRRTGADVRIVDKVEGVRLANRSAPVYRRYPILYRAVAVLQSFVNFVRFWAYVVRLAWLLRRQHVELVHLNNSVTSNHHWMMAAKLARVPCVTHERGINVQFTAMARWVAPRLDAILCISQAVKDSLIVANVASANLRLVPNGLDPAKVVPRRSADEVRASFGIHPSRRAIGMLGNIRYWKGQEVLVRALPAIARSFPDVICLFVGETSDVDREYFEQIQRDAAELGVERHIIFTGHAANVADFLNVMELSVHASVLPEPFGRVLLEAMAMKRPVVGSGSGAVTEIVVDGETGKVFTPGDPAALAAAVCELLQDPQRSRALGEAGYRRLCTEFHVSTNVSRTMGVYAEVLGGRVRAAG
jgi:glycosyltransferase involved in cell wall biosynthesis